MTHGASGQGCRPLMSPRLIMRSAVILCTPMILAAASSVDLSALGPFAVAVACDLVMAAEAAHALVSPTIAVAGRFTATIEQPSDLGVRHQPGQLADERDRILGKARMVPAGRVERELELQGRVIAALPMQGEVDDWPLPLHHDLLERRAQDPLAGGRCRRRVRPS